MSRRIRTDRMRTRAITARTARHLREAVAEVLTLAAAGDDWWRTLIDQIEPIDLTAPAEHMIRVAAPPESPSDWDAEEIAKWQRAWDETIGSEPHRHGIIWLPSRTTIRPRRPRKSTPRGVPRMREHTRSLLINALRSDGTLSSTITVQTCKAYRVLPWDIGFRPQNSTEEPPPLITREEVEDAHHAYVIEPIKGYVEESLTSGLMTYEQMRAELGIDEPFTPLPKRPGPAESDFERLWSAVQRGDPDLVRAFNASLDRRPPSPISIADLFYNPTLIATTGEPWPSPGWFGRLIRRIIRKNGARS